MIDLLRGAEALKRICTDDVTALTKRATASTYYTDGLSADELEAIARVDRMAADTVAAACANEHQLFIAALVDGVFAGYMVATVHAPEDRELDWLMIDPAFQGHGVADALMAAGVEWLGADRPIWLNVIQHNARAIRFYRRHGFEVDAAARTDHRIPHFIMRARSRRP